MKENAEKFRALDPAELDKQLREGAEQMFRLRFQMSMGQTDVAPSRLRAAWRKVIVSADESKPIS